MSAKKNPPPNPFLKKAAGPKPPTRNALRKGAVGHGLGRGLDNLITPSVPAPVAPPPAPVATTPVAAVPPAGEAVLQVPPLDLERSPWQPRTEFSEEALKELADSIKSSGVIEPIVCRRRADGKLELIAGERRLRASVLAGLKKVPVVVRDADDATAATMTITENAQRDDLNPIDEAVGYRTLIDQFGFTQEEVSERVGKSRPAIANSTRLLELPDEVRDLVRRRHLSTGHAKVLLGVADEKERILLAREAVTSSMTVRDLERKVARLHAPVVEKRLPRPDWPDFQVRALTDAIRRQTGCVVRLTSPAQYANGKRSKGLLEFDLGETADLDRLLGLLGVKVD